MSPYGIIEAFNILANGSFSLLSCFIRCSPNQLRFKGFKDGFDHGIEAPISVKWAFGSFEDNIIG
jgi:hypothetical protein